jgi:hypothetical protein
MVKLAADENFNNDIIRGLLRRVPSVDIVRLQDVGLSGAGDEQVLAWAAAEQRILLTHDVSTMTRFAYERVARGEQLPGVFEVAATLPVREAIEDLVLIVECSDPDEWERQVRYLPLR